jgi:hypothetical protein
MQDLTHLYTIISSRNFGTMLCNISFKIQANWILVLNHPFNLSSIALAKINQDLI